MGCAYFQFDITHYVDLGENARYALRYVSKDKRASPRELDEVYFNNNRTMYNVYPSDQVGFKVNHYTVVITM